MSRSIVVGSRGSKLALVQAESVAAGIREKNPEIMVSISRIVTRGDQNHYTQLDRMDGIGVFTKELEEALLDARIDLAVHSLKDMPTEIPSGLRIAAVTERLDPRDVLVSRGEGLAKLASGARVGTGSPRRAVQLAACRPDLEVGSIRGNIDTRLRKVADGEFDAVILAAAGLKRLGWEGRVSEYLPTEKFLPAVGQGALAIEIRLDDEEMAKIAVTLNHLPTWQCTTAERAFLSAMGGGCRAPMAALGAVSGDILQLEGMVAEVSKGKMLRFSEEGSATAPQELGRSLAQKLLAMGAGEFIAEAAKR